MNATFLIVVLSLMTMLAVLVFAIRSKEKVERLRRDATSPQSSLSTSSPGKSAVESLE